MQITIPKITRPLHLTDYDPSLTNGAEPAAIHVWVNPTRDVLQQYADAFAEKEALQNALKAAPQDDAEQLRQIVRALADCGTAFVEWYALIWSQAADTHSHFTPDEVRKIAALETDPGFYAWVTGRTWELIAAHRAGDKKK